VGLFTIFMPSTNKYCHLTETVEGVWIANRICWTLSYNWELQINMYNASQISITHTSLLRLIQPPLVVAWLQPSNKGYSSDPYGSKTALLNWCLNSP
jgi:hypothetical protein